jgi:2-phospho-L-lactate guanylyltransferase
MQPPARWTVIVPVKPPLVGKSRLGRHAGFATAVALDTIEAAVTATRVGVVVVVTADAGFARAAAAIPGVRTVIEDAPRGIAAAIEAGVAGRSDTNLAVLLGDLPALRPAELDAALDLAAGHDRAFVPDAEGTGTTLVTARAGVGILCAFGAGSAARHVELGLEALPVAAASGLRRDVDDPGQLAAAMALGLGSRSRALSSAG